MEDLFAPLRRDNIRKAAPLAERMRPQTLEQVVGQEEILAEGTLLNRAIRSDSLRSLIFFGPPGTGKTSIAAVIAATTKKEFVQLNAVTSGVQDIRRVVEEAEKRLSAGERGTIVFIDEIHRFNKTQQDGLLPSVEKGIITLIGATTENPFFRINSALLSRSLLFRLKPLGEEEILSLLHRALEDEERGLGGYRVEMEERAVEHLARFAAGDVRSALNALELAVLSTPPGEGGVRRVSLALVEEASQQPFLIYDRDGDNHYDVISAFIKSMRGSDPDATVHYLARMLEAGEDPLFIARRIVIHAAEDVGLADPLALVVAESAYRATERIGLPEARIPLAEAALYVARAPKSNKVLLAIDAALADVRKGETGEVPTHLRCTHYAGAAKLGSGEGYKYPHDYPEAKVEQEYLPEKLRDKKYF